MEHCVSSFLKIQQEKAYKVYVTDCLYSLANMYAVAHGGKEPVQRRFAEILEPPKEKPEESADDIISRMREKAKRMN